MSDMRQKCCSTNRCKTVNIRPIHFRFRLSPRPQQRMCHQTKFRSRWQKRPDTAASGGKPNKQLLRGSSASSEYLHFHIPLKSWTRRVLQLSVYPYSVVRLITLMSISLEDGPVFITKEAVFVTNQAVFITKCTVFLTKWPRFIIMCDVLFIT